MTRLYLETVINAEKEIVFDASRNLDIHKESLAKTNEKAVSGRKNGLIEFGETVTWSGKHFGLNLKHESKITQMKSCVSFTDEMVSGSFKTFVHHHQFISQNNSTLMIDEILYETPFGFFGKVFDVFVLKKYLRKIITERNDFIKKITEKQSGLSKPL